MSLADKIRQMIGHYEPGMIGYANGEYYVASWPTNPKPTIADIEAVVIPLDLPAAKAAKQSALDAWWKNHPGVSITVAGQTVALSVQKTDVAINRLEILSATLESRNARIFDKNGLPVTVALADIPAAAAAATTAIEAELTAYYTVQSAIGAASNESEINAVSIPQ